ncbi:zinc metalloprotease [Pyxidicoccus xibeiensis]|uniref:hypothetical protein n=1 Tax=Pyxidicoccus xibeiensis TaxID=2906759 RepID=UPI0020A82804|nr:hypothetical protein [Pyxidicoccus xibeiensis]MCP3144376.1 hypothetical protein [Pyxidicoccus xibeiensis]
MSVESSVHIASPDTGLPASPEPLSPEEAHYLGSRQAFLSLSPSRGSWLVLLGSLVFFVLVAARERSAWHVALLTAVLFIHEAGHWVGMRIFGFRDVQMFFIPFFGAAVSGRNVGAVSWHEALVLLLGPLPGIVLGAVLGAVGVATSSADLGAAGLLFLAVNGFNLLPVVPLDGGRLFQVLLFSRHRHLEVAFSVFAGLTMLALSIPLGWVMGLMGMFTLFGLMPQARLLREVHALRRSGLGFPAESSALDEPAMRALYASSAALLTVSGEHEQPEAVYKERARAMQRLHERVRQQPPTWGRSLLLATLWGGGLVVLFVGLVLCAVAMKG